MPRRGEEDEPQPRALTASVSQIKASDLKRRGGTQKQSPDAAWQREAYDALHSIGEVRFATRFISNALGKVKFGVGMRDYPGGPLRAIPSPDADIGDGEKAPTPMDEAMRDCLQRLRGRDGTFRSLVTTYGGHQFLAGEDYLVGAKGLNGEEWEFLSTSELVRAAKEGDSGTSGGSEWLRVTGPGDQDRATIPDGSVVYRFWQKDLEFRERADSSVRAVLDICDSLRTARAIKTAGDRSRLVSNGLLLIPAEAELPTVDIEIEGELVPDHLRLVDELIENMEAVMADPGSAAATIPLILSMKKEAIEAVKHVTFGRQIDETIVSRIDHDVRSLAQGLDLVPEKITGVGDVNHWTAWQVSEETISAHVGPLAQAFCEDLTVSFIIPTHQDLLTQKSGVEQATNTPEAETWRYAVIFDLSDIVESPNAADHAKWAWENLIMSDDDALRVVGFDPGVKPSMEEVKLRLAILQAKNGQLGPDMKEKPQAPVIVQPPPNQDDGEGGDGEEQDDGEQKKGPPASGPPTGDEKPKNDEKKNGNDDGKAAARDLLAARVVGAAAMAADRALEKAAARLATGITRCRDETIKAQVNGSPNARLSVILGPGGVERLGLDDDRLLQDAWMPFAERMVIWGVHPDLAIRIVTATDNVTRKRLYDDTIDIEGNVQPLIDLAIAGR